MNSVGTKGSHESLFSLIKNNIERDPISILQLCVTMTTITMNRLKSNRKVFEKHLSDHLESVEYLDKFASVSKFFLSNVDSIHLQYYLKEFYVRMAYVFDIQDTLEFGRLRSKSQTLIHNAFMEPTKLGCYMAIPHEKDKSLRLTACSHEGIQYGLNCLEV
jgi:hypothetical protein